ncbi:hypothetical protein GCM10023238_07140 [Streptomyces heliomycini]
MVDEDGRAGWAAMLDRGGRGEPVPPPRVELVGRGRAVRRPPRRPGAQGFQGARGTRGTTERLRLPHRTSRSPESSPARSAIALDLAGDSTRVLLPRAAGQPVS